MNGAIASVLYRAFSAKDELLYIGVSAQPDQRLREHQSQASWWAQVAKLTLEHFPTRDAALEAEGEAIAAEQPLLNVRRREVRDEAVLSVRLDREHLDALRESAQVDHRSLAGAIRHLIATRIGVQEPVA